MYGAWWYCSWWWLSFWWIPEKELEFWRNSFLISCAVEGPSRPPGMLKSRRTSRYIGSVCWFSLSSSLSLGSLNKILWIASCPLEHTSTLTLSRLNCSCSAKIIKSESSTIRTSAYEAKLYSVLALGIELLLLISLLSAFVCSLDWWFSPSFRSSNWLVTARPLGPLSFLLWSLIYCSRLGSSLGENSPDYISESF